MPRLFSKGCEYALRVLTKTDLAGNACRFSVKKICKKINIPEWYTRKIFQALTRKGILTAAQGPGGGYCLKKSPARISVLNVVEAIDGPQALKRCVMGLKQCGEKKPCVFHPLWKPIRFKAIKDLDSTTLEQLRNHNKRNLLKKEGLP